MRLGRQRLPNPRIIPKRGNKLSSYLRVFIAMCPDLRQWSSCEICARTEQDASSSSLVARPSRRMSCFKRQLAKRRRKALSLRNSGSRGASRWDSQPLSMGPGQLAPCMWIAYLWSPRLAMADHQHRLLPAETTLLKSVVEADTVIGQASKRANCRVCDSCQSSCAPHSPVL